MNLFSIIVVSYNTKKKLIKTLKLLSHQSVNASVKRFLRPRGRNQPIRNVDFGHVTEKTLHARVNALQSESAFITPIHERARGFATGLLARQISLVSHTVFQNNRDTPAAAQEWMRSSFPFRRHASERMSLSSVQ